MRRVYTTARQSDDRSTRNGALLICDDWVVLGGYNHMMDGFGENPEHHERPFKYRVTEHAERDVLMKCLPRGIKTQGMTMMCNWAPCPDCARAIVAAQLVALVVHKQCMDRTPVRWKEQIDTGLEILEKGGVSFYQWDGKVGDGIANLNCGEVWYP